MSFTLQEVALEGIWIIQPSVHEDPRGFFKELFHQKAFARLGLEEGFIQDNMSKSGQYTVRGLHFQRPPFAQGKLVTVVDGEALDVVVDLRKNSATYGKVFSLVLSGSQHNMIYIPPGFAHGFSVLSPSCLFFYKCTNDYHRASEGGIRWDDPDLAIDWRVTSPVISAKDREHPFFRDFDSPF